jgi:23S rRNA pseudouridine1911/1915/1917 synthase
MFARREVHKLYLALVAGTIEAPLRIDEPLGPDPTSAVRIKMGVVPLAAGGQPACTDVEPLAHGTFRGRPITGVACRPRSGRQHQIRVHLAARGHGILGDKLYGIDERHFIDVVDHGRPMEDLEEMLGLPRHALHAAALRLDHPATGAPISFTAPWPARLAELLDLRVPAA